MCVCVVQNVKDHTHLQPCPPPAAGSAGGRSSPGGRTGCVSSSPSASPCSTGYAPETRQAGGETPATLENLPAETGPWRLHHVTQAAATGRKRKRRSLGGSLTCIQSHEETSCFLPPRCELQPSVAAAPRCVFAAASLRLRQERVDKLWLEGCATTALIDNIKHGTKDAKIHTAQRQDRQRQLGHKRGETSGCVSKLLRHIVMATLHNICTRRLVTVWGWL